MNKQPLTGGTYRMATNDSSLTEQKNNGDYRHDCDCDECENMVASTIDLIRKAKKSPTAKKRLNQVRMILDSALASGILLISVSRFVTK